VRGEVEIRAFWTSRISSATPRSTPVLETLAEQPRDPKKKSPPDLAGGHYHHVVLAAAMTVQCTDKPSYVSDQPLSTREEHIWRRAEPHVNLPGGCSVVPAHGAPNSMPHPLLMRHLLAVGIALAAIIVPAQAQRLKNEKEPKRPKLFAEADTNSAGAYYYYGTSLLDKDAAKAADAFYWASRLDPSWADPLYARRIALLMRDKRQLIRYVVGDPGVVKDASIRQIDSLQYYALLRNPFLYTKLERTMLQTVYDEVFEGGRRVEADRDDPGMVAWLAYSQADFPKALEYYAKAAKRQKREYWYHGARARVFYLVAQYDSAAAEQKLMIEGARTLDKDKLI
jgi:hypothetical protein